MRTQSLAGRRSEVDRLRLTAERMFRLVPIGHLKRGEAWDALGIPLAGSGRAFELALVGEIVERTGGYSHFLQFLGGLLCSRVGRANVALADHQALESSLIHELDLAFFEDRYLVAGTAGRRVLASRAGSGRSCSTRRTIPGRRWPSRGRYSGLLRARGGPGGRALAR